MVPCLGVDLGTVKLGEGAKQLGLYLKRGEMDSETGGVEDMPV